MSARVALSALLVSTVLLAGFLSPSGTAQVTPPTKEKPRENINGKPFHKVYQVIDLITPLAANPAPAVSPCPGCATCQSKGMPSPVALYLAETHKECCTASCPKTANTTDEDKLLRLIKTTIAPKQWSDAGGPCTAEYWPLTGAVVINAPPDLHEQIMELLSAIRRLEEREVALEVRFISIDESLYKRLSTETGVHFGKGSDGPLAILDDKQTHRLMEVLQRHPLTQVMQAPKVTLFDGQSSMIRVMEEQQFVTGITLRWTSGGMIPSPHSETVPVGMQIGLTTGLSADLHYIDCELHLESTHPESGKQPLVPVILLNQRDPATGIRVSTLQSYPPGSEAQRAASDFLHLMKVDLKSEKPEKDWPVMFTQFLQAPKIAHHTLNSKLILADGKTALLYGWKQPVEREQAVPVLSELPCIGQCFKCPSRGVETVLVMVTPRVLRAPEEEERATGYGNLAKVAAAPTKAAPKAYGDSEESENTPNVDELLAKYHKACAAGKLTAARRFAIKALTLDPTCFDEKR
jgi:hypothetical protein